MADMCVNSLKSSDYQIQTKPQEIEVTDYIPETKPDTFEKAEKPNDLSTKVMVGTIGGVAGYQGAKSLANKVVSFVRNESKEFLTDIKNAKKAPGILKWGVIAAGTIVAGILATKDTDKDGKLDIVEAVTNFFKPL